MILRKNFWNEIKRTTLRNNKSFLLVIPVVFILTGCFVKGAGFSNDGSKQSTYQTDLKLDEISGLITSAENNLKDNRLNEARDNCDEALKRLLNIKDAVNSKAYERLHGKISLTRIKINHSRASRVAVVESDLFPLIWNSRVEKWINYYTSGRGRKYFIGWMKRSGKYIDTVRDILRKNELPLDLAYVPVIESGYYPFARSSQGATGLWQFMKTTGKRSGLNIDYWKDERRDPVKATNAAAKFLKNLYNQFGSWEMALAGYNYGPNGVRRRIKKWNTNDYWEIYLPRETENFVPKIMAAIFIMKEPELFGMDNLKKNNYSWKEFKVEDAVDLRDVAEWARVPVREVQLLNPELKQMCTPPDTEYSLRIPEKSYDRFVKEFTSLKKSDIYLTKKEIDKRIRRVVYHRVRPGDSIWKISRRYGVSMYKIKKWNNLSSNRIFPRQKLKIYRHGL